MVYGIGRDPLYKKYSFIYHLVIGTFLWVGFVLLLVSFFSDGGFASLENEPFSEKLSCAFCLIVMPLAAVVLMISGVKGIVKHIRIKNGTLDENEERKKEEERARKLVETKLFDEASIAASVLSKFYSDKYPITKKTRRKPSKNGKSIRKILAIYLPIAAFMSLAFFLEANGRPGEHNNFLIIGFGMLISIPVTLLVLKSDKNDGKKPLALGMNVSDFDNSCIKYHGVYLRLIQKKGYTNHTIEKADIAIESYQEGANISILYLKDYILLPAEYSMIKGYYDRALEYLNVIDPKMLLTYDLIVEDIGFSYFAYYALKMEICAWSKDRALAEKTMEEVKPKLTKEYKGEILRYVVDSIYFEYYMALGEYSSAKEYSYKLLTYKNVDSGFLFSAYISNAQVDLAFGEYEEAQMFMDEARKIACGSNPTQKQAYNSMITKLDVKGEYFKI